MRGFVPSFHGWAQRELKVLQRICSRFQGGQFLFPCRHRQSAYWSQCLQDRFREVGMGPEEIF